MRRGRAAPKPVTWSFWLLSTACAATQPQEPPPRPGNAPSVTGAAEASAVASAPGAAADGPAVAASAPAQSARPAPPSLTAARTETVSATPASGVRAAPGLFREDDEPVSADEATRVVCAHDARRILVEPGTPKRHFSVHGYFARPLRIERIVGGARRTHCIVVAWPPGSRSSNGKPSRVARTIDAGWFRAIANTLARVPWHHVRVLERIVIDNHPKEHGIAPFDRMSPDDGRDGRTLWLHEHLFLDVNHWAYGNHGSYWSYHVNEDETRFDDLPADHPYFSPVFLHELGHLVMYNVINGAPGAVTLPPCARTCTESNTCDRLPPVEREKGCVSPYCMPFRVKTSTENWAEQYRFYYQSSTTRALLARTGAGCLPVLSAQDSHADLPHAPPWELGLPDITTFRPSRWTSCGGRPCKGY